MDLGVPHLLSPPQAVVVGPRERLGKEPGEALPKKAGSHCERLQDAGAGRRAVRIMPPRTRGAGARRQAERDAGRGGGWAAEGPVCGRHSGGVKGGISTHSHFDFSLLFHYPSLFRFPRHSTTFPPNSLKA